MNWTPTIMWRSSIIRNVSMLCRDVSRLCAMGGTAVINHGTTWFQITTIMLPQCTSLIMKVDKLCWIPMQGQIHHVRTWDMLRRADVMNLSLHRYPGYFVNLHHDTLATTSRMSISLPTQLSYSAYHVALATNRSARRHWEFSIMRWTSTQETILF